MPPKTKATNIIQRVVLIGADLKLIKRKFYSVIPYVADLGYPPSSKPMQLVQLIESKIAEAYRECLKLERLLRQHLDQ